ncbi:O-antigen ligase family protein [Daejeonella oryzae]|uniref:O-antigen ligase family protein n=1 Tax=Daejeonella oryzae TaxID=1122943 RepID=UPI00047D2D9A|nr:O-antigen ligase family protein [Daejeonella oryzae]
MRKVVMLALMLLFIYTLTFDIFMNRFFRIPTPILTCIPLIIFFKDKSVAFLYKKEIIVLTISLILYYFIGSNNLNALSINLFVLTTAALYFNYYVGLNPNRFKKSILYFIAFLLFSAIIMLLNQFLGVRINSLRSLLIGAPVRQSPSGITATIFNFGYQLAPVVTFIFIYACTQKKNLIVIMSVFLFSIICIYFGLQRSVLVSFGVSVLVFSLIYYRFKSVIIILFALVAAFALYTYVIKTADIQQDNILAKNERTEGGGSRAGLVTENLKILTDHPFGLIFYGKNWEEVTYRNPAFRGGLTSHNAYLMFITYLGPFFGIGLLFLLYYPIWRSFKKVLYYSREPENALLVSLCFSFLAVSLNALFHNAWLLNANGPTVFLYFGILHLGKQLSIEQTAQAETEPNF